MLPLTINWPLSSTTGYGVYGLQILLQHLRRGGDAFVLTDKPIEPLSFPPPFDKSLPPLLEQASKAASWLEDHPKETLRFAHPVLHGVGNWGSFFKNQLRVKGRPNIGCAAIEEPICPPDWKPFLALYDKFIAISDWNAAFLRSLNLAPVRLHRQGIDTTLFYEKPPREKKDRFIIFSGGKFEFRKGQDIVLETFKRFHEKHPEAFLLASWQSRHQASPEPFIQRGYCKTVPRLTEQGLDLKTWLLAEGLPENSFESLPFLPNSAMPEILHGADVAIFPNRCEGGTNLVAMEALACGLPTYVAANTGQKDLIEQLGCACFKKQTPVSCPKGILSTEGWGETDIEETLEKLEEAYTSPNETRAKAHQAAEKIKSWDWSHQNEALLQTVYEGL